MEASNVKAMRDALLNIQEYAAAMDVDDGNVLAILDACRDALSAPPRQCDVGTAEEQETRFNDYCRKHYDLTFDLDSDPCKACPFFAMPTVCRFAWAQMPYEAQEGSAK